jgi:uncharacterized protein (DUF58 family)
MLDRDTLRRIRRLELTTRKAVSDALAGQYHSVFKGRGMAFSEVRPYQPGDEVRAIDWNVTARAGEPFVKVFTEERELTVLLLVDVSASGDYGSKERSKAEAAAELCAQVAFSAIENGDRVGLVLFSNRLEKVVPPRKGRKHVLRLIADVLTHRPEGRGTDLTLGLSTLLELQRRTAVVFLLSDFLADGYERALRIAARRHDVVPVAISDPAELRLPDSGLVELEDPETGERLVLDSSDPKVRADFEAWADGARASRERLFRRLRLDALELRAGDDNTTALRRFFHARAQRSAA